MNLELDQKYFLVTGASRGIGKAIAERLLNEGAIVGLVSRGSEHLEKSVKELQNKFGIDRAENLTADCANNSDLRSIKKHIERKWKRLDGVIANVGDGRGVNDAVPDEEQWATVWRTNFETALCTTRIFLPILQENKGCLLFTSSICGLEASNAPIDYSTAKTAIIAFAQNLARQAAPEVRVNVIAPGNVNFPGSGWEEKLQSNPRKVKDMLKSRVPMRRFGKPEEIADAAAFLCSNKASFITGTVLRVDGGQVSGVL